MKIFSMALMTLLATCWAPVVAQESQSKFDDPVFLQVDDAPMNEDGKMMYPSPVVFDIDNDGTNELVIGTIFGALLACENSNEGSGDPVWEAPVVVNTHDGEPIDLNNW